LLAGRYRIIGLLGKGGMGQVYRADDLKLGQAVALKFLPDSLARDGAALARFHGEVRTARQISHPSVCRVFDIGEIAGQHYLTMEYIDGEDLASLIRRIGRLPSDKALELARQICAGLAAAHDLGVLHRDLKPANVMIDGRGRARIADFGLAGLATEFHGAELASGTPAYMAPEQLAGREVTVRSDLYALGLVLYEMFTGRRAFEGSADPRKTRGATSTVTPTSIVKDLDPLIERVIQRCLETDPALRPASALQVAAALPGGDPLAAALAAGETPSPEMVAAAPTEGALSPRAVGLFLVAIVALVLAISFGDRINLWHRIPHEKSPEVMADHASTLLASLGWSQPPASRTWGIEQNDAFFAWKGDSVPKPRRFRRTESGQPFCYYFWYRQSPVLMAPLDRSPNPSRISVFDPPYTVETMATVETDLRGRLIALGVVPPARPDSAVRDTVANWDALFVAAGLDRTKFTPEPPPWTPPVAYDRVAAWKGTFADHPDLPMEVEAASMQGRPVFFVTIAPWDTAPFARPSGTSAGTFVGNLLVSLLIGGLATGAAVLGRRNLLAGSGDRDGALRAARVAFVLAALAYGIGSQQAGDTAGMFDRIFHMLIAGLLPGMLMWGSYIALEPHVRRNRPELIVSWARLIGGNLRDPLIGRDLLIGTALGLASTFTWTMSGWLKEWFQVPYAPNHNLDPLPLSGTTGLLSYLLGDAVGALSVAFAILIFISLLGPVLRGEKRAAVVLWLIIVTIWVLFTTRSWPAILFAVASGGLMVFTSGRFGLVASVSQLFVYFVTLQVPFTTDFSAWYAVVPLSALLVVGLLVAYGVTIVSGSRRAARERLGAG
jgi:serine/threonine-protein kinase